MQKIVPFIIIFLALISQSQSSLKGQTAFFCTKKCPNGWVQVHLRTKSVLFGKRIFCRRVKDDSFASKKEQTRLQNALKDISKKQNEQNSKIANILKRVTNLQKIVVDKQDKTIKNQAKTIQQLKQQLQKQERNYKNQFAGVNQKIEKQDLVISNLEQQLKLILENNKEDINKNTISIKETKEDFEKEIADLEKKLDLLQQGNLKEILENQEQMIKLMNKLMDEQKRTIFYRIEEMEKKEIEHAKRQSDTLNELQKNFEMKQKSVEEKQVVLEKELGTDQVLKQHSDLQNQIDVLYGLVGGFILLVTVVLVCLVRRGGKKEKESRNQDEGDDQSQIPQEEEEQQNGQSAQIVTIQKTTVTEGQK